ncbi:TPA: terminase TerL endonuclease subunit, partial [Yersinia enterocolitica]
KANPNMGVSIEPDFLRAKQQLAISTPSQTNKIKTKHFNIWVTAKSAYYNMEKWKDATDKSLTLEQFKGEECYLGIDLASKLDLNCACPIFMREINSRKHYYCVGAMFWAPEDTIYSTATELKRTAERYQNFVQQGFLIPTDGAEVDNRLIFETISK